MWTRGKTDRIGFFIAHDKLSRMVENLGYLYPIEIAQVGRIMN
jgi:hypothetical protein